VENKAFSYSVLLESRKGFDC